MIPLVTEFVLPFPPSVNGYWRSFRGSQIISEKGRYYRAHVARILRDCEPLSGRLRAKVYLWMPDRRKRDLDNYQKALFDSLVHAGALVDDSLIDRLVVMRMPVEPPGRAVVRIYSWQGGAR